MPERTTAPPASAFVAAVGGVRGLLDSGIPATVFVLVRVLSGSLSAAVVVALASGLALGALRRARGEPLQQVGSGFLGLLIAVGFALITGKGKGFFLPGIVLVAGSGVLFVVSLVLRKPAVGIALEAYDAKYAGWRDHPGLRRAVTLATAVWAGSFFLRAGVATWVYTRPGDHVGQVFVVINVVKYVLIVGAALVTVRLVKASGYVPPEAPSEIPPEAAAQGGATRAAERPSRDEPA